MKDTDPVLLVEDNPVDIENIRRALRKLEIPNPLYIARHGEEARDFLNRADCFRGAPKPALILVDLNMPVMNGLELIELLKADANTSSIPVVVITTSAEARDIEACHAHGVAGYFTKPIELAELETTIATIFAYWKRSEMPRGS